MQAGSRTASESLQNGADVRHVQKLLGHAHVETTALHTRVEPGDLKKAFAKAHPRERAYNRRSKRISCVRGGQ